MSENKDLETSLPSRGKGAYRTLFKDTLARALLAEDSKRLRAICEDLCDMATDKNISPSERQGAIKIIMERVEGKPAQAIEISENTDRPSSGLFKIVKIEGQ